MLEKIKNKLKSKAVDEVKETVKKEAKSLWEENKLGCIAIIGLAIFSTIVTVRSTRMTVHVVINNH